MIAIVLATEFELGDHHLDWKNDFNLKIAYLSDQISLIISGPGLSNAALSLASLEKFKDQYPSSVFVNLGIAGGLGLQQLGQVLTPGVFSFAASAKNESALEGLIDNCYPEIKLRDGTKALTVPVPLWDDELSKSFAQRGYSLVDMESYIFAAWALKSKSEFHFIKFVSDHADQESKTDFKTNVKFAISKISNGLSQIQALISSSKRVDLASINKCFGIKS